VPVLHNPVKLALSLSEMAFLNCEGVGDGSLRSILTLATEIERHNLRNRCGD